MVPALGFMVPAIATLNKNPGCGPYFVMLTRWLGLLLRGLIASNSLSICDTMVAVPLARRALRNPSCFSRVVSTSLMHSRAALSRGFLPAATQVHKSNINTLAELTGIAREKRQELMIPCITQSSFRRAMPKAMTSSCS